MWHCCFPLSKVETPFLTTLFLYKRVTVTKCCSPPLIIPVAPLHAFSSSIGFFLIQTPIKTRKKDPMHRTGCMKLSEYVSGHVVESHDHAKEQEYCDHSSRKLGDLPVCLMAQSHLTPKGAAKRRQHVGSSSG